MDSSTGSKLLLQAEIYWNAGERLKAFETYMTSIHALLQEDVNQQTVSPLLLDPQRPELPPQTLAFVWRNMCSFLGNRADMQRTVTRSSHPAAFQLLDEFRPTRGNHPQFENPEGRVLLLAMQVMSCLCLGKWAWLDEGDSPRAAKILEEGLRTAQTHAAFCHPGSRGLPCAVYEAVGHIKSLLTDITNNDAEVARSLRARGHDHRRKETVFATNSQNEPGYVFSTTSCANCGQRKVKLQKCARCRSVEYCDRACQTAHWTSHKAAGCHRQTSTPQSQAPAQQSPALPNIPHAPSQGVPLGTNNLPLIRTGTLFFFHVRHVPLEPAGWLVLITCPPPTKMTLAEDLPATFAGPDTPSAAHDIAVALRTLLDGDPANNKWARAKVPPGCDPDKEFFFASDNRDICMRVGNAMAGIPGTRSSTHKVELMPQHTEYAIQAWREYLHGLKNSPTGVWREEVRVLALLATDSSGVWLNESA